MTDAQFAELAKRAPTLVIIRWFAPGVGLVKEQIGDPTHYRELVAVDREGTGVDSSPKLRVDTISEPSTPDSGE